MEGEPELIRPSQAAQPDHAITKGHGTGVPWPSFRSDAQRDASSKRSRFITLLQTATKSFTNFAFAESAA